MRLGSLPNVGMRLDFKDGPIAISFNLAPAAAVSFFRAKGLKPTFAWQDMLGSEHRKAFTVAKMLDVDLLGDVHASLVKAMADGQQFGAWRQQIQPLLEAKGWWGKRNIKDTRTGLDSLATLGSPARLQTIFRTNMQSSYAVGQWHNIQVNKEVAPLLMYDAVDDHRTRPEHARLDGLLLPVDDDFWKTHSPPNGWNCRCGLIQMTAQEAEDRLGNTIPDTAPAITYRNWTNPRTGQTHRVPVDLDPGWDYNPGDTQLTELDRLLKEKIETLPTILREAALRAPGTTDPITAAALGAAFAAEAATYQLNRARELAQQEREQEL